MKKKPSNHKLGNKVKSEPLKIKELGRPKKRLKLRPSLPKEMFEKKEK